MSDEAARSRKGRSFNLTYTLDSGHERKESDGAVVPKELLSRFVDLSRFVVRPHCDGHDDWMNFTTIVNHDSQDRRIHDHEMVFELEAL